MEVECGQWVAVGTRLRYHRADPFAIYLDTHLELYDPVTWIFGRDLLSEGLVRPAGLGDVTVRRCGDPWALEIILAGEGGPVALRAPVTSMAGFLQSTWESVPAGDEPENLDIDSLLQTILGGGPGSS
ncbi:SsgA family sporulation/cell division regulator [Kitasatospora purpeofusca]|uniref:SsgA family sporulation/cell division regulator n=1 Tax=Kitasatospora purpeofusca TaxID=67352 RepID=UPI003698C895